MTGEPTKLRLPPISPAAPGPLYQQIVDGIKREIGAGRLEPNAPLPSFRALAEALLVSLITVKRAYEELEREGIIRRRHGLGTFVAEEGVAHCRATQRTTAETLLRQAIQEARHAGMNDAAITALFQTIMKERTP